MRKKIIYFSAGSLAIFGAILFALSPLPARWLMRSFPSNEIFLGKIQSIQEENMDVNGATYTRQTLHVQFLSGDVTGTETDVHVNTAPNADPYQKLTSGETVILSRNHDFQGDEYEVSDRYRLPALFIMGIIFVAAVLVFGQLRGFTSLLGLAASIAVLLFFIVPRILHGANPLLTSFEGAVIIAVASLYLAHGWNPRTTIALAGTLITLGLAVGLAVAFTSFGHLIGFSSDASFLLKLNAGSLSLRGILLAGIIIGMLGVLDDVTIGQSATIYEIKQADPSLDTKELYRRGISVGREHIASLVNTLVLAYAGSAFSLFLLIIVQSDKVPLWLAINGEPIAEEIVRTLVGSLALVFAVPITTFFASYYYGKRTDLAKTEKK